MAIVKKNKSNKQQSMPAEVMDAIKSIQRAGKWARAMRILYLAFGALLVAAGSIAPPGFSIVEVLHLFIMAGFVFYWTYSSNRLIQLDKSGNTIVTLLIINTFLGLIGFIMILPIFVAVFSIIALTKIGIYKRWLRNSTQSRRLNTAPINIHDKAVSLLDEGVIDILNKEFNNDPLDWDSLVAAYSIFTMVFVAVGATKNHDIDEILEDVDDNMRLISRNGTAKFRDWLDASGAGIYNQYRTAQTITDKNLAIGKMMVIYWNIYNYGAPKYSKILDASGMNFKKETPVDDLINLEDELPKKLKQSMLQAVKAGEAL